MSESVRETRLGDMLDLREQITRIDRSIAETGKFQQEAAKFRWERWLALGTFVFTYVIGSAVGGAVGAWLFSIIHKGG